MKSSSKKVKRLAEDEPKPEKVRETAPVSTSSDSEDDDEVDAVQLFKSGSTKSFGVTEGIVGNDKPSVSRFSTGAKSSSADAITSFKALRLDDWICENLEKVAIRKPTPVQISCVPPILNGCRILSASAPTGSGKTAAFALPILDRLARDPYGIYALVLTPTRELALQIGEQFSTLGAPIGIRCEKIIGGVPITEQQLALVKLPHVVVATPGRFAAHVLGASPPRIDKLKFLVLDESDRLLTPGEGFENDLKRISDRLPKDRTRFQTLLFSATSKGAKDVERAFALGLCAKPSPDFQWDYAMLGSPADESNQSSKKKANASATSNDTSDIVVKLVPSTLTQTLSLIPSQAKHAYVTWFMKAFAPQSIVDKSKLTSVTLREPSKKKTQEEEEDPSKRRAKSMIVFTSTCEQCQIYSEMFAQLELPCAAIHAELQQKTRMDNLNKFRAGQVKILIATDVASRGLDIPQVDVVLNLDVPRETENYVHRIGRCARAGRLGRSFMFVTQNEIELVKAIEVYIGEKLNTLEINDDEVAAVLHKASVAKRKAVMKLHDDGFMGRIKIRKERRLGKKLDEEE